MALIIDPDNLSQGTPSAETVAFTASAGAETTMTGTGLPVVAANEYFEIRDHFVAGNNGLYRAKGTPTTSSVTADKVDGVNPANASSEAVTWLGTSGASTEKSVMFDLGQKRIYLLGQGNLSVDGVTEQALYSFAKEEWKADSLLITTKFPIISITPEQFEYTSDWELRDVTSPAIQSKKLIRTGGFSEITVAGLLKRQYTGVITLGTFEDDVNDLAYYQLGDDPTDVASTINFAFNGPVNEPILVYEDFGVPTNIAVTGNNTITKSGGTSFITFGFRVGGRVTISSAEDAGNNGSFVLTSVTADVLTVSGAPLTNNADDDTMRLAADNRNAVKLFLRIRDADPNGKTYDSSDLPSIGVSVVDNKAFRFPLTNATDLNISASDATITGSSPYTQIVARYFDQAFSREVDNPTTNRDFGIVVDVGTHSGVDGSAPGAGSVLTTAEGGMTTDQFAGGVLTIHEGTDKGLTFSITANTATTITVSGTLSAGSNLSFTAQRASPVVASKTQIYEKIQFLLRQASDIDSTDQTVSGKTADELLEFVGPDLRAGSFTPVNPNGGGSGVIIEGFDANDTNNLFFFDNLGISRNFPFVAAGTINFNDNLVADSMGMFWVFFQYTTRTTVADMALSGASGSTASLDSAGANLPSLAQNDYIRLAGFTDPNNNGIWVVTDATPSATQADIRKVDGKTVSNETAASRTLDQNPVDSPQAIIVNDNGGSPIAGVVAAQVAFDFDYDNNVQGGRAAGTDAAILIRAIGLETAQFAETTGTIVRATGQSFSVVAGLERNYSNP